MENLAERVQREVGPVHILVNNAGVLICKNFLEHTEHDIRRTLEVNVTSQFWVSFQQLTVLTLTLKFLTFCLFGQPKFPIFYFFKFPPLPLSKPFLLFLLLQTLQAFLPAMVKAKSGHVVTLSSASGMEGQANGAAYSTSKFAVRG